VVRGFMQTGNKAFNQLTGKQFKVSGGAYFIQIQLHFKFVRLKTTGHLA
jgi:hypothetical protein